MLNQRLAINEFTTPSWSFRTVVETYARLAIPALGVLLPKIRAYGCKRGARLLRDAGLRVSSLCVSGFFLTPSEQERRRRIEETLEAIEIAAMIEAETLVLIAGPAGLMSVEKSNHYLVAGLEQVLPAARASKVRLALEPLHPMYASEASLLCSIADTLALLEHFPPTEVGLIVDTYHLWWDRRLLNDIVLAGSRIFGVHLSDWRAETRSFCDRTLPGRGVIPWTPILHAFEQANYTGYYELEILSRELWRKPPLLLLEECLRVYREVIEPHVRNPSSSGKEVEHYALDSLR